MKNKNENVRFFVNNIRTEEGGTDVSATRVALTRALNDFGKRAHLLDEIVPTYDDYRRGLTAVISLRVQHPQWASTTRQILANREAEGVVNSAMANSLSAYLEEHPHLAEAIFRKGVSAARVRAGREKA